METKTKEQEGYVQSLPVRIHKIITTEEQFTGCLLGGAVGDVLGTPVKFEKRQAILEQFGEKGIKDFPPAYGRRKVITTPNKSLVNGIQLEVLQRLKARSIIKKL